MTKPTPIQIVHATAAEHLTTPQEWHALAEIFKLRALHLETHPKAAVDR